MRWTAPTATTTCARWSSPAPGRGFCAGADLSGGANTFNAENRGPVDPGLDGHRDGGGLFTLRLYDSLKPTIAACNGPAVGVGITMQLAMDVRLASEAARYGFVFTRRAIVMEACSSWFLPRLVGPQQALEWVMTGRVFPAEEALRGRLVRSVHKPDELLPAAYALAREIADNTAPVSVALNRQMIWKMLGADHPMEAHKVDSKGIYARGKSADVKEGVTAFLEKRPAKFPMKVSDGMPSYFPWWTGAQVPVKGIQEEHMSKTYLRRRAVLAAVPALVAAPYIAHAQGKPEKTKVVLAVGGKSALYYLSLTIAERKGFFKDAGLDVEINDFQGGSKSLEALMGGSADVTAGAYEHTLRMQQRGQAIKGFVLMGRGMQIAIGLRKEVAAKVKGPADIKGMKFGVSAPGSSTHMLLLSWAAKGGLKATDVVAIGVGAGATVVAAIEKGQVDGVSQTDPALTILQDKGMIEIKVDTRTAKGNQEVFGGSFPAACLYAQPASSPRTPNTAQALATAIVRADEWLQTASPADVAKTVPEAYLLGDQNDLREVVRRRARDASRRTALMPAGAQENCLKFLVDARSQVRGRQGQDQARGHVDQRVRAARQEARVSDRGDD